MENTKGVIKSRKSKKDRQYNGQQKYDKQKTNNNLQTQHRKLKIEEHELYKTQDELRCCGKVNSSCFTSGTSRVTIVVNPMIGVMRKGMIY